MRLKHQQRFRYGNPTTLFGRFRKYSSILYFVAAWNVAGCTLWTLYDKRQSKTDPSWDKLSSAAKVTKASSPTIWEESIVKRVVLFGRKDSSNKTEDVFKD